MLLHFNKCNFRFNVGLLDLLCIKDDRASQPCCAPLGAARVLCLHSQQTSSCCIVCSLSGKTREKKNLTFHFKGDSQVAPPINFQVLGRASSFQRLFKRSVYPALYGHLFSNSSELKMHTHTHRESIHTGTAGGCNA